MHQDTARVRIVGGGKAAGRGDRASRDLPTALDPESYYDMVHYTSEEGLAGIKSTMKLLSGAGCYGHWVYVTRFRSRKTPLEIGPTLFDGAGPRLAKAGRLNCCVRLEIQGKYLMPCISEDPTHSGFCYNGGRKGAPAELKAMKGMSAKKQKALAKQAGEGPALVIEKEMKPRFYTYRETGQRQMLDGTFRTCGTWRNSVWK
ncbi:hypothetical protein TrCOL_g4241 [Triparma columacea]|uniref:Uncharacterized protein n=1 Tax=Triparma columacea TaxID=722753 RepID=A0A9W7GKM8_9STRA|nr:hypothetical protein TrCOL_g4241 [Triparma columacea]